MSTRLTIGEFGFLLDLLSACEDMGRSMIAGTENPAKEFESLFSADKNTASDEVERVRLLRQKIEDIAGL